MTVSIASVNAAPNTSLTARSGTKDACSRCTCKLIGWCKCSMRQKGSKKEKMRANAINSGTHRKGIKALETVRWRRKQPLRRTVFRSEATSLSKGRTNKTCRRPSLQPSGPVHKDDTVLNIKQSEQRLQVRLPESTDRTVFCPNVEKVMHSESIVQQPTEYTERRDRELEHEKFETRETRGCCRRRAPSEVALALTTAAEGMTTAAEGNTRRQRGHRRSRQRRKVANSHQSNSFQPKANTLGSKVPRLRNSTLSVSQKKLKDDQASVFQALVAKLGPSVVSAKPQYSQLTRVLLLGEEGPSIVAAVAAGELPMNDTVSETVSSDSGFDKGNDGDQVKGQDAFTMLGLERPQPQPKVSLFKSEAEQVLSSMAARVEARDEYVAVFPLVPALSTRRAQGRVPAPFDVDQAQKFLDEWLKTAQGQP